MYDPDAVFTIFGMNRRKTSLVEILADRIRYLRCIRVQLPEKAKTIRYEYIRYSFRAVP